MPDTFSKPYPDNILMSAYYRNPEGFLRQVDGYMPPFVSGSDDLRNEVINMLHTTMEKFIAPVLVAIKGGKP
ncbi:MAG: hypothetical protein ACXW1D_00580 [Halobacteriota archaeon]